jgi:hypothetical protein
MLMLPSMCASRQSAYEVSFALDAAPIIDTGQSALASPGLPSLLIGEDAA